jgi:hypothetical protein
MKIFAEVFPNHIKNIENKGTNFGTPLCKVWCSLQLFVRNFAFLTGLMQRVLASNVTYIGQEMKELSVALVRERTIPTERPPPVGEVSANFCG